MISIDITLVFQVVNFLITLFILNVLIIRPIREVLARRRAHNAALAGDAGSMKDIAARKLESYEARLVQARAQMASSRDAAVQSGRTPRSVCVKKAPPPGGNWKAGWPLMLKAPSVRCSACDPAHS